MGPPIPQGAPNSRLRATGRACAGGSTKAPNSDFTILSETEDWIALDEPPHLLVHPSLPTHRETLWDGLKCLLSYELVNGGQISIITRLDRETSGVVLVTKHSRAARQLGLTMQRGLFSKTYLAVVFGWPVEDDFTIDEPLRRAGEVEESAVGPSAGASRWSAIPNGFPGVQRWSHGGDGGLPAGVDGVHAPDRSHAPDPGAPESCRTRHWGTSFMGGTPGITWILSSKDGLHRWSGS